MYVLCFETAKRNGYGINQIKDKYEKQIYSMYDIRGYFLGPPHGMIPAAGITNNDEKRQLPFGEIKYGIAYENNIHRSRRHDLLVHRSTTR